MKNIKKIIKETVVESFLMEENDNDVDLLKADLTVRAIYGLKRLFPNKEKITPQDVKNLLNSRKPRPGEENNLCRFSNSLSRRMNDEIMRYVEPGG
jgi:hypothetical protein